METDVVLPVAEILERKDAKQVRRLLCSPGVLFCSDL
jgi:hypothetical protein